MQTDVLLQKALVNEVKEELKGYTSINNAGEYLDFNVYPQNLPAKKSKNEYMFDLFPGWDCRQKS